MEKAEVCPLLKNSGSPIRHDAVKWRVNQADGMPNSKERGREYVKQIISGRSTPDEGRYRPCHRRH